MQQMAVSPAITPSRPGLYSGIRSPPDPVSPGIMMPTFAAGDSLISGDLRVEPGVLFVADEVVQLGAGLHPVQEALLGPLGGKALERLLHRLHGYPERGHGKQDEAAAESGEVADGEVGRLPELRHVREERHVQRPRERGELFL